MPEDSGPIQVRISRAKYPRLSIVDRRQLKGGRLAGQSRHKAVHSMLGRSLSQIIGNGGLLERANEKENALFSGLRSR
jgi:hypothetical protein